jgi:hypothetical protein
VHGSIYLVLPAAPNSIQIDGQPATWRVVEGNVYHLAIEAGERAVIVIDWSL